MTGYIHWTICKRMGLQVTDEYDEHMPERVINFKGITIMWDVPVTIDRTLLANRPDIVLFDKKGEDLHSVRYSHTRRFER